MKKIVTGPSDLIAELVGSASRRRLLRFGVSISLAVLALSACAALEQGVRDFVNPQDSEPGSQIEIPTEPVSMPPPPGISPRPKPSRFAAAAAPQPEADPNELIGQTGTRVVELLGPPGAEREQPPARIWEYEAPECTLTVHFYLNLENQSFEVLRYEVVRRGDPEFTDRLCYGALRTAGGGAISNMRG